jgi:hypothetical protein
MQVVFTREDDPMPVSELLGFVTQSLHIYFSYDILWLPFRVSPGAALKLLFCDHEVMGSSTGKSLLQKRRKMLCT